MSATEFEGPTQVLKPSSAKETESTIRMDDQPLPGPRPGAYQETMILGEAAPIFAWLVIREGPRAGRLFTLNPKGTSIGRDPQCEIILDDESVSRQHAKLRARKGKGDRDQYSIWDLASANGTLVNGQAVVKKPLKDGDEVMVGRILLVFKQV